METLLHSLILYTLLPSLARPLLHLVLLVLYCYLLYLLMLMSRILIHNNTSIDNIHLLCHPYLAMHSIPLPLLYLHISSLFYYILSYLGSLYSLKMATGLLHLPLSPNLFSRLRSCLYILLPLWKISFHVLLPFHDF